MSSDNGIFIDKKTLKAYHWQGDGVSEGDEPIATGKTLEEVLDNVQEWIKQKEKEYSEDGYYFQLEYGISFSN